uniref:Thioredoxin domain-containing protein n=1 Tax=Neobodo designis TaxID=312471 RepID=A0A7S1L5N2_NEODS|mmetsp:Transcript_15370/g.47594  ORF Transcript_15370/g.47594 Transcript_15370/m.47594 type:complete len:207 (+) Transcript_15370:31-651(+)
MADAAVEVKTYSDDPCLGQVAPSLELLEFVEGAKIDLQPGRVHVLFFWVSYYKGAWVVNEELTQLAEKNPEVQFIAISNDADRAAVEKFLKKIEDGRVIDENTKKPYRLAVSHVAYDDKKAVGKAYADLSNNTLVHVPQAFIVDKDGKVAWRQNLTQSFTMTQSNFADQLERVVKGEALDMSNGPKPKVEADEGEDVEVDGDLALF